MNKQEIINNFKDQIPYIAITIIAVFVLIAVISMSYFMWGNTNVEDIRIEYLDKYSEKSKKIQKEIDWREDRKRYLKDEIEDLDEKMDTIQICQQANSMTGAVVDCSLYYNNKTE